MVVLSRSLIGTFIKSRQLFSTIRTIFLTTQPDVEGQLSVPHSRRPAHCSSSSQSPSPSTQSFRSPFPQQLVPPLQYIFKSSTTLMFTITDCAVSPSYESSRNVSWKKCQLIVSLLLITINFAWKALNEEKFYETMTQCCHQIILLTKTSFKSPESYNTVSCLKRQSSDSKLFSS